MSATAEPESQTLNLLNPDPLSDDPHNIDAHSIDAHNANPDEQIERDKKIAVEISKVIERALDTMKPMLNFIKVECEKASKLDPDDLDEQALVDKCRPMIEECSTILNKTLGQIKGMDPEGTIAGNAQKNYTDHSATPEEQRLAKALAELTGEVTKTIEDAKEKIKDMPKAKQQLGALFGLMSDPLIQILSAVGLLLNGVLTLVGNLLDVLGLGGLLRGVLAGLGLDKILKSLGLGQMFGEKKDDSKKKK